MVSQLFEYSDNKVITPINKKRLISCLFKPLKNILGTPVVLLAYCTMRGEAEAEVAKYANQIPILSLIY